MRLGGVHGRALEVLGRLLLAKDREEAVTTLMEAATVYDEYGMAWHRGRVLRVLRGLGSRGRRAAGRMLGPDALTEREREVASLAVEGHTAEEIGQRLHISRRTVESHLGNAYAKLGVGTRVELARRARELGLDRDG